MAWNVYRQVGCFFLGFPAAPCVVGAWLCGITGSPGTLHPSLLYFYPTSRWKFLFVRVTHLSGAAVESNCLTSNIYFGKSCYVTAGVSLLVGTGSVKWFGSLCSIILTCPSSCFFWLFKNLPQRNMKYGLCGCDIQLCCVAWLSVQSHSIWGF